MMHPPLFLDTPSPRRACASDDLPAKPSEVPATLTRYEATQRHWHTVVIGAGPTGSSVAMRLARAGLRVLLIDRDTLPRGKVCGCCISPQGVSELRLLGFSSIEESLHATPLHSLVLSAAGKQVHLPLLGGAALSRERLDAALANAATRAGADFLPKTTLTQIDQSNVGVRCTLRDQESTATLSAMSVVIAAGLAPRFESTEVDRSVAFLYQAESDSGQLFMMTPLILSRVSCSWLLLGMVMWELCDWRTIDLISRQQ